MILIRSVALSIIFSLVSLTQLCAQKESFESLLGKGKAEFKKDFEEQDYAMAASYLKKAVTLEPENAEAHYFLGYAYSRLNSKDGRSMIDMDLQLNKRCSDEFEQVIQLTPKYTGELVVLDPYSKLTSEWGSMAMCYLKHDKLDSAVWAFNEGKRRGGFGEFFLAVNRRILSQCSKKAILMTSGDNITIPLWYLQLVENYRADVTVIDVGLLNTTWYPQLLKSKYHVSFDQPQVVIDTLEYVHWKDSMVFVRNKYAYKDFSWTVKPTIYEEYLQRSDQLFLSILKANEFESDVYFTIGFAENDYMGLNDYLYPMILLDQVNVNNKKEYDFATYLSEMKNSLDLIKTMNLNSTDQFNFVEQLRYNLLIHVDKSHKASRKKEVMQLLKLLDTYLPDQKFPYPSDETKKYVNYLRKQY
ncbi:MAG: tetratricopeptide repeat protein [Cytophagaceae bacterium]|jgi:hypothetical protein|nr:tetratricopeptide repeat protein [Cytophagaceae bacterium]